MLAAYRRRRYWITLTIITWLNTRTLTAEALSVGATHTLLSIYKLLSVFIFLYLIVIAVISLSLITRQKEGHPTCGSFTPTSLSDIHVVFWQLIWSCGVAGRPAAWPAVRGGRQTLFDSWRRQTFRTLWATAVFFWFNEIINNNTYPVWCRVQSCALLIKHYQPMVSMHSCRPSHVAMSYPFPRLFDLKNALEIIHIMQLNKHCIIRLHRLNATHEMRLIATNVTSSVVRMSVC